MNPAQLELLLLYIDSVALSARPPAGGAFGGGTGASEKAGLEERKNRLRDAFRDAAHGEVIEGVFTRIGD